MTLSNIPVIYEDDWFLIVDKPSGLLTIPTPRNETRTLSSILNDEIKKRGATYRLHPCHRLDRETSGLIIYAKGKSPQKKMMEEFKNRKVNKKYIAFLQGYPGKSSGEINSAIDGLSAVTRYKVIEKKDNFAIVEVTPLTGRTNQIRIHFKRIGCPILGETRYAFRKDFKIKAKRLCLHASQLDFIHPITSVRLAISCELPVVLKEFADKHNMQMIR